MLRGLLNRCHANIIFEQEKHIKSSFQKSEDPVHVNHKISVDEDRIDEVYFFYDIRDEQSFQANIIVDLENNQNNNIKLPDYVKHYFTLRKDAYVRIY